MSEKQQSESGKRKQKKIPEADKRAFVADYFDSWDKVEDVAKRHGIGRTAAYEILRTNKYVDKYLDASKAINARTKIYINKQAENAARKQVEIMNKPLPDHLLYLIQNAVRDIMDRAGIRPDSEGKQDIRITFGGGIPEIGMPESADSDQETGTNAGEE